MPFDISDSIEYLVNSKKVKMILTHEEWTEELVAQIEDKSGTRIDFQLFTSKTGKNTNLEITDVRFDAETNSVKVELGIK